MERKTTEGPIRSKARKMQRMLDAVGEIIRTEGYTKLGINHIARMAGVDKKLIYRYFGSANNLIETYVRSKDYWMGMRWAVDELVEKNQPDHGQALAHTLLVELMDYLKTSPEMRAMILWEVSEKNRLIREISGDREKIGRSLFGLTDPHFEGSTVDLRAIYAILTTSAYYLNLHSAACGGTVCEIDFNSEAGRQRILDSMHQIVDWSFAKIANMSPPR